MGLFERQELKTLDLPPSLTPKCGACGLYKTCQSPKMLYSGSGQKGILVVAESPGKEEDKAGRQLVGNSGQELQKYLRRIGIDMRRDCWLENSLACRPEGNEIKDDKAIEYCRPHVIKSILELKPRVIILLGAVACKSVFGWLWKDSVGGVERWAGYRIPHRGLNTWICPTYHPSYLLQSNNNPILERQFAEHLSAASKLRGRPYSSKPDDFSQFVEVVKDVDKAAGIVSNIAENAAKYGLPIAFDYETTTLKPHGPYAEIYSCSIAATEYGCGTDYSFAFPWYGKVVDAMRNLLSDPKVTKYGQNIKFEESWTRYHLGVRVRGWQRDSMLASHALENGGKIRAITGIKFQAFVKLGVDCWDDLVKSYLKSEPEGGNTPNRIKQASLDDVLLYNAYDSLYELKVGRIFSETIQRGNQ